ncbi:peptidoglycan DD-metalloendopeptidase family protein [Salibacterium qingdaonense]|uniref:LysM domain-containing protein n=1 Tax=Salibacterium qingdaonense TaxID=266892 RepID=A0A1I4M662_9BACI|nr:peptidoglycan DD-metalloendopeptidase family protein [Salibacterium qingdaonense]SFL98741.1 LysM domain-containing protein [Salibacterium qingdaonense]
MSYVQRFVLVGFFSLFLLLLFFFIGASSMYAVSQGEKDYIWPLEGGTLTDTFGSRQGNHDGIDIAAETGTKVKAAADGEITRSDYSSSYGHVVMMKHDNDTETVYAHLSKRMVKDGEKVEQGEIVGQVGNTGRSRGPHLHFELHFGEWNPNKTYAADPLPVLQQDSHAYAAASNDRTAEIAGMVRNAEDKNETDSFSYTIEKGDTLWDLARTYDTTVDNLQDINDIEGSLIYPDQEILIA